MEMDDGQAGYYSDLLNRVDTTITQSRSAYGGEHSEEESNASGWFDGEHAVHFHTYALWGAEGVLPSAERKWIAGLFFWWAWAVSLETSRAQFVWILAWFVTTLIVVAVVVAARLAAERVERDQVRRTGLAAAVATAVVWWIVRLATLSAAEIRSGMRVFIGVVTLGLVVAEAAARIVVSRCDPDALRRDTQDDLQYAAL